MFRDRQQVRLSDVSSELGVAHSTAHRLLAMLTHYDFVRHPGGHGAYTAGPALLEIGYGAVRSLDLRSLAQPFLHQLARTLDETVQLAQLEGGHIRYIAGVESSQPLRVADRTGQLFPAHQTATGKAILAGLTADQLRAALTGATLAKDEEIPEIDLEDLEHQLTAVRSSGYAFNHRDDGVISLATEVRNQRGFTVAAINASAPENRMPPERRDYTVSVLRKTAEDLGNALHDG
ncbi:hypothetical protein BA062_26910 [Prauserella flavalba]|uniref:IclR family transcriptional regulator n=2 Tax=Prauserella flavalba TaxID=1477506 RepID=A0A318LES4_9PSEU|nr:hypothetical protein BA062_26910 [Prauserella flavalba]